jgi:Family of unknown function (DUF5677)
MVADQARSIDDQLQDRVALTPRLMRQIKRMLLDPIGDLEWDEAIADPLALAERVSAVRQYEALQAVLVLAEQGLGHLGVAYVRPACEEYIWLEYLNSIDPMRARRLLQQLSLVESARSLRAQQQYMGDVEMIEYGFPADFVDAIQQESTSAKLQIEELAADLGWPSRPGKGRTPTASWIARQINSSNLYDFLYSATSRMLHFSPHEIYRRGWGDPSQRATVSLNDPAYTRYRRDFALYWLVYLFIRTCAILKTATGLELREGDEEEFFQLVEQFSLPGSVPIVRPEEYNSASITEEESSLPKGPGRSHWKRAITDRAGDA